MNIHIVVHESFESPGAIDAWIKNGGHRVTYTRLYSGEAFPRESGFDFLIVMGGPQSPATTLKECPHFDAKEEIRFIKRAIDENKLVLGICLGAQLIGEALGAHFEHSPNREIGAFTLKLTVEGENDRMFAEFPKEFVAGHWHGDMPGLTPDSQVLATSEGCPRQIVRYTPRVYGFQCHLEFTSDSIEDMIINNSHELSAYKELPYIQTPSELRINDYATINSLLFTFLDRFVV